MSTIENAAAELIEKWDTLACGLTKQLAEACRSLRTAALNMRGEFVTTKQISGKTLGPMFKADDQAQAALAQYESEVMP